MALIKESNNPAVDFETQGLRQRLETLGGQMVEQGRQVLHDLALVADFAADFFKESMQELQDLAEAQRVLNETQRGIESVVKGEAQKPVTFFRKGVRWQVGPEGSVLVQGAFLEGWEHTAGVNMSALLAEEMTRRDEKRAVGLLPTMRKLAVFNPENALDLDELELEARARRTLTWFVRTTPTLALAACSTAAETPPAIVETVTIPVEEKTATPTLTATATATQAPTATFTPSPTLTERQAMAATAQAEGEEYVVLEGQILEVVEDELVPVSGVEAGVVDRIEKRPNGKVVALDVQGKPVAELSGNEWVKYQPEYGFMCNVGFNCNSPEVKETFSQQYDVSPFTYPDGSPVPWGIIGHLEGTTGIDNVFVHGILVNIYENVQEMNVSLQIRVPFENGDFIDIFISNDNYTNTQYNTYGLPEAGLPEKFGNETTLTWKDVASSDRDPAYFLSYSLKTHEVAEVLLQNREQFIGQPMIIALQANAPDDFGVSRYNQITADLIDHIRRQDPSFRGEHSGIASFKIFIRELLQRFKQ